MLGASLILRGSYSNGMRCLSRYWANITSYPERMFMRLPAFLTNQLWCPADFEFSTPTVEPTRLCTSSCQHPQECVCSQVSEVSITLVSRPQSQRQTQKDAPLFDFSSSRRMAVNLPNRCPATSLLRFTPFLHPQDKLFLFHRTCVSLVSNFPQSQRHNHILNRFPLVFSMTVRLPNRRPAKSDVPNFSRQNLSARSVWLMLLAFLHPHDVTLLRFNRAAAVTFVFPHVQRQSQCAPCSCDATNSITVRCPNTLPVKSSILPIALSNNNARHAAHVKLPRPHIRRDGRSYQYSTRACGLGNSHFTIEGAI